jgi:hypothetical protein
MFFFEKNYSTFSELFLYKPLFFLLISKDGCDMFARKRLDEISVSCRDGNMVVLCFIILYIFLYLVVVVVVAILYSILIL